VEILKDPNINVVKKKLQEKNRMGVFYPGYFLKQLVDVLVAVIVVQFNTSHVTRNPAVNPGQCLSP
jgi:hypothetical protein